MGVFSVKVEGADGVVRKLGVMGVRTVVLVRPVVNKAALDVQREARVRCPVDTGRLRASIRPRFYSQGLAADVFTDVEYAPFVEFGTRRMAAKPYLFPAWEVVRPQYLRELEGALRALGKV